MSILITPTVASAPADNTSGAGTTLATAGFKLAANILYFAALYQRHTTPASLGNVVSIVGTTGGAWTPIATKTYGGASPGGRQSYYWFLSSTDIASEVVTATISAAQTTVRLRVYACGGTRVATPIVQVGFADSAGASVSLLVPGAVFTTFGDLKNGAIASYMSSTSGALNPKSGWTEAAETSANTIDSELQWIGSNDQGPSVTVTGAAAPISLIGMELAAPANSASAVVSGSGSAGALGFINGTTTFTGTAITIRAGRTAYLQWCGGSSASVPAGNTMTFSHIFPPGVAAIQVYNTQDITGADNRTTIIYRLTVTGVTDVSGTIQTVLTSSFAGNLKEVWQSYEISNLDTSQGSGGQISLTHIEGSATGAFSLTTTPSSRENFFMLFGSGGGNISALDVGWQIMTGAAANTMAVNAAFRPNAPIGIAGSLSARWSAVAIELAGKAPVVPSVPPVITRISPPLGSIAPNATLVVESTDVDGDLTLVTASIEYPTLGTTDTVYTGSGFSGAYTLLSLAEDTTPGMPGKGKRLNIARSGGFPDGAGVILHVTAVDAAGNIVSATFTWSPVAFPAPPPAQVTGTAVGGAVRGRDIKINASTNRFSLVNSDLALVGGVDSIVQAIRQAVLCFLGEWFLDERIGVDWLGSILGVKNPDVPAIRAALRAVIVSVPGVDTIHTLSVTLDSSRHLAIGFQVSTDLGEIATGAVNTQEVI